MCVHVRSTIILLLFVLFCTTYIMSPAWRLLYDYILWKMFVRSLLCSHSYQKLRRATPSASHTLIQHKMHFVSIYYKLHSNPYWTPAIRDSVSISKIIQICKCINNSTRENWFRNVFIQRLKLRGSSLIVIL